MIFSSNIMASGHTLLEMALVLAIVSILSVTGFSFSSVYHQFQTNVVRDEIYTLLNASVSLARIYQHPIIVSCDLEKHLIIANYQSSNRIVNNIDSVSFSPALKIACPKQIQFNPDGQVFALAAEREPIIYQVGKQVISIDKQTAYVY